MPTTDIFPITVGSQDANVKAMSSSVYPPNTTPVFSNTDTTISVAKDYTGLYEIWVGLLKFDTAALPDNIDLSSASAWLRVWVLAHPNVDSRSVTAEWFTWSGGTSDYTSVVGTNAISGVSLSSLSTAASYDLPLINLTNINPTGTTYLRLHISGGAPTGNNYMQIASLEDPTNPEPKLVVTYTLASASKGMLGGVGA